ncbi:uncharacterized protein G2W53_003580 [Senna tora]|uniref:Uncharacterized protein n=1 Tax=Senna tora TaxID=362788 RepID=A0A834XBD4_9FABA|nr:uncharacterized protein G2W53_003580 [Senna tora]
MDVLLHPSPITPDEKRVTPPALTKSEDESPTNLPNHPPRPEYARAGVAVSTVKEYVADPRLDNAHHYPPIRRPQVTVDQPLIANIVASEMPRQGQHPFMPHVMEIPGLEDLVAIHTVKIALRGNPFYYSLVVNEPKRIIELLDRVDEFVIKEKAYFSKKGLTFPNDEREESKKRKDEYQRGDERKRERQGPLSSKFPSYNLEEVYSIDLLRF